MKIFTIWERTDDPDNMPWLVYAIDEYTIDENGTPEEYIKAMKERGDKKRELIIEIPEQAVLKLFTSPIIKGKTEE